jgi:Tol biopolymer transport system component
MSLAPGTRLGNFEIIEAIGKGGMGEVFKARDTRLDRLIAIKILPAEWASDPAMRERFDREAQAIASLSHPHICALHDVGTAIPSDPSADAGATATSVSFLVMEFLAGETLAARISRGPLSLDEALDVAVPIADALDQAHRRGVIHRDLKPGNIMLTKSGPKLLDFGLARTPAAPIKRTSGSGESGTVAAVPTTPLTTPGLLIGTLQYMAPEQLDGFEADARTDIFSFGTVLHEMVTGKRAFQGKTQVLLISSIATSDPPPLSSAEPATPPALDHVVKTCLAKDPDDRWQTARDLLAELRWIAEGGAAATAIMPAVAAPARRSRAFLGYGVTAAALAGAAFLAAPAYSYFKAPETPAEVRYRVWESPFDATPHGDGYFAISPDGRNLVHRGDEDNINDPQGLYVSRIGDPSFRRLPGTDEPTQPFWSPAGDAVAFLASGQLMRVNLAGGPPQLVTPVKSMFGGAWNADNTILFGSPQGIYRVSAEGGTPELLVAKRDTEAGLYWPQFLPDGRRFLYLSWTSDAKGRAIMLASIDDPVGKRVLAAESNASYTPGGHLVFHRADALYAQPFDLDALAPRGEMVRLATKVMFASSHGYGAFAVARDGTLVYGEVDPGLGLDAGNQQLRQWQPAWVDRLGREIAKVGSYQLYRGLEVAPDGKRIALHRHDEPGGDVWIIEPTGTDTRLTFDPARDNSMPIWSPPKGEHIVFGARRQGKWALMRRLSDGRGTEDVLYESDTPIVPMSWSPDGLRILFGQGDGQTNNDLLVLTLESPGGVSAKGSKPEVFVATPFNETHGQISPDGRWIAYASNETKADQYEIYVRPFPTGAGRWQVSRTGGDFPRWSRDGKELFFLQNTLSNFTQPNTVLSSAKVGANGDTFVYDPPVDTMTMRSINLDHPGGDYPTYAVGDGGKFLTFIWASVGAATATAATAVGPDQEGGLTVARHWEARIRR